MKDLLRKSFINLASPHTPLETFRTAHHGGAEKTPRTRRDQILLMNDDGSAAPTDGYNRGVATNSITEAVIGGAIEVHRALGPGLLINFNVPALKQGIKRLVSGTVE